MSEPQLPPNVHWIRVGIPDEQQVRKFRIAFHESARERYDSPLNEQAERLLTDAGLTVTGQSGGAAIGADYDDQEAGDQDFIVEGTMMAVLEATIQLQEMLDREVGIDPDAD